MLASISLAGGAPPSSGPTSRGRGNPQAVKAITHKLNFVIVTYLRVGGAPGYRAHAARSRPPRDAATLRAVFNNATSRDGPRRREPLPKRAPPHLDSILLRLLPMLHEGAAI
jgi:hypothetical protein